MRRAAPILLFGLIAALYVLKMPTEFVSGDSTDEVGWATSESPDVRSSHLLTTPFYRAALKLNPFRCLDAKPFLVLQLANILLSVCCSVLFYATLRLLKLGMAWALFLAAASALADGMVYHTTFVETTIQPQLCLVLAIYCFVRYRVRQAQRSLHLILFLVAISLCVLFALNMVVLVPAAIAALACDWLRRREPSAVRVVVTVAFVFGLLLTVPFIVGAQAQGVDSASGFLKWMLTHPESDRLAHMRRGFDVVRLARPGAGLVRVFWYAGPALSSVRIWLSGDASGQVPLASLLDLGFGVLVALCSCLLALGGAWVTRKSPMTIFCCVGLGLFYLFNAYWTGGDSQFWLPGLPLLLLLIAERIRVPSRPAYARRTSWLMMVPLAAMVILAFRPSTILPSLICPQGGPEVRHAREFGRTLAPGDVVVTPDWLWAGYLVNIRADLIVVDLVYDELGQGVEFRDRIAGLVNRALRSGRAAYFDDLTGRGLPGHHGAWEMVRSGRGVSRVQLAAHLAQWYELRPMGGPAAVGISRAFPRGVRQRDNENGAVR